MPFAHLHCILHFRPGAGAHPCRMHCASCKMQGAPPPRECEAAYCMTHDARLQFEIRRDHAAGGLTVSGRRQPGRKCASGSGMDSQVWTDAMPYIRDVLWTANVVVYGYCIWLWGFAQDERVPPRERIRRGAELDRIGHVPFLRRPTECLRFRRVWLGLDLVQRLLAAEAETSGGQPRVHPQVTRRTAGCRSVPRKE